MKIEPLIGGVVTGKELWFSNNSIRLDDGTTGTVPIYVPGQAGNYWASTLNGSDSRYAYNLSFSGYDGAYAGFLGSGGGKLYGLSVRCVR